MKKLKDKLKSDSVLWISVLAFLVLIGTIFLLLINGI